MSGDARPGPAARPLDERLDRFRAAVLRWNRSINLISRVDPDHQVTALIAECQAALSLLEGPGGPAALAGSGLGRGLAYADIGAGAGFPGIVWCLTLAAAGRLSRGWLVEPRERRAWFLARSVRDLGLHLVEVVPARWGDWAARNAITHGLGEIAADHPHLLLSLKALRLDDAGIVGGLPPPGPRGPASVVVVRFLPRDRGESDVVAPQTPAAGWSPGRRTVLGAGDGAGGGPRLSVTVFTATKPPPAAAD